LLLITCGGRLGCGGVTLLLASYDVSAIAFDLHHFFSVLVSSPERIIVENLPTSTVDVLNVTGYDPDLRLSRCGHCYRHCNQGGSEHQSTLPFAASFPRLQPYLDQPGPADRFIQRSAALLFCTALLFEEALFPQMVSQELLDKRRQRPLICRRRFIG
jgi:hypothetical protein